MKQTLVLNVVGLTPELLAHAPRLQRFARQGQLACLDTILPAVTCSVQTTYLTGVLPSEHGIVGNGWYFQDLAQIWLWRQSNALVRRESVWDVAKRRDPSFTCAQLFWWYNMYNRVDWSVTPRPMYTADGRKIPDVYTAPAELREELVAQLGQFPLFQFWGPRAGRVSSEWIAACAMRVLASKRPTLTLVYLPHLDYDLQRWGPNDRRALAAVKEVDDIVEPLLQYAEKEGLRVIVLSEYGITQVTGAVFPNRVLRQAGFLRVRQELGREQLDAGASSAFAVADHQVAHVYVQQPEAIPQVKALLEGTEGVERVLDAEQMAAMGLLHERSGQLLAISQADRWFSYYFWLQDEHAPDYARTVDIHAKPGYDPVELFLDPSLRFPALAVGRRLLLRKLGFRRLLDVIPLDTDLVRGSHGRLTDLPSQGPLFISNVPSLVPEGNVPATAVRDLILSHVFDQ
jgi:predicted AlkP superfamily pyrophosphatase or phosphodiesterase